MKDRAKGRWRERKTKRLRDRAKNKIETQIVSGFFLLKLLVYFKGVDRETERQRD